MVIKVKYNGEWVKIPYLSSDHGQELVEEAPKDGSQYARQNGVWSVVNIPEVDFTEVYNAIDTKVDKVEGSGLISDTDLNQIRTNKSNIESLQTSVEDKQDLLTAGEAITISEENTIDLKLDAATDSALSKSADGLKLDLTGLKGSTIKIGTAITGGVDVGADQTIVAGMQALSNSIQTAVSGGITSLTSPDETLTISGSGTSRSLVVNVAKIVSANSAIQVGTDGKLDIFWNEIS